MTIYRKVLVVMRSCHLHTELVEVTARVNVIGDPMCPSVEADLAAIESQAREVLRRQERLTGQKRPGFGPRRDIESAFEVDFMLCAPIDADKNRDRIVQVQPVATETIQCWGKGLETRVT